MSDVEAGGATVFPLSKAVILPQKGGAAFCYNLHPNGQGNVFTLHAACPVLVGSKWGRFNIYKVKLYIKLIYLIYILIVYFHYT